MCETKIICWQRKLNDIGAKIIIPKIFLTLLNITKDDNYISYCCINNKIIIKKSNRKDYLKHYKRTVFKEPNIYYSGKLIYIKSTNGSAAGSFYVPKKFDQYLNINRKVIPNDKSKRNIIKILVMKDKLILEFRK